jgi:hypothetical protein
VLGVRLYIPVYIVYLHQLGLSKSQVGLLWSLSYFAQLAFDGPTGLLADVCGYRKALMLGSGLLMISFLVYTSTTRALGRWNHDDDQVSASLTATMFLGTVVGSIMTWGMVMVQAHDQSVPRLVWLVQAALAACLVFVASAMTEPVRRQAKWPGVAVLRSSVLQAAYRWYY